MRRRDDDQMPPDVAAELEAIDATLAGEPVDPTHAELAELSVLLAAARPEIDRDFAEELDERVERRFAERRPTGMGAPVGRGRRSGGWTWKLSSAAAAATAVAVAVVVIGSGGGVSNHALLDTVGRQSTTAAKAAPSPAFGGQAQRAASAPEVAPAAPAASSAGAPVPQPPTNGRKIVQSAQLALTAAPNRVEDVAQGVFDVIGREHGIVRRSSVTATGGTDGSAEFELSVPSSALQDTMSALSRLQYAHVSSRTDNTQDVNDQYVSLTRRLADARALRTGLLKQLAGAVTQQQIDSLQARIHDAEAAITRYETGLRSLNRATSLSQVILTINAAPVPVTSSSGSSFTIGKALHTAGRVLTVAAGVALIALAVLVPVALLGALGLWIGASVRRRRREHALDVA